MLFIRKRPLDSDMDSRSRRRRVTDMREVLLKWAEGEGVSITALLGFLLYLDNWHQGDRNIADLN